MVTDAEAQRLIPSLHLLARVPFCCSTSASKAPGACRGGVLPKAAQSAAPVRDWPQAWEISSEQKHTRRSLPYCQAVRQSVNSLPGAPRALGPLGPLGAPRGPLGALRDPLGPKTLISKNPNSQFPKTRIPKNLNFLFFLVVVAVLYPGTYPNGSGAKFCSG